MNMIRTGQHLSARHTIDLASRNLRKVGWEGGREGGRGVIICAHFEV